MQIITIKKRQDFKLSHLKSEKSEGHYIIVQKLKKKENGNRIYFGFTVTKRIGIAVIRNKIKRRLKSIINILYNCKEKYFEDGCNYIFVSKIKIKYIDYCTLKNDILNALTKLRENNA